jgi:hypothetical protein
MIGSLESDGLNEFAHDYTEPHPKFRLSLGQYWPFAAAGIYGFDRNQFPIANDYGMIEIVDTWADVPW